MRLITRWSWLFDIECCRCFSNSCNIRVSSGKGWSWSWIRFGWWWRRRRQYAFNINVDKYWLCFSYWYTHQAVCPSDRPTDRPTIYSSDIVSQSFGVGRSVVQPLCDAVFGVFFSFNEIVSFWHTHTLNWIRLKTLFMKLRGRKIRVKRGWMKLDSQLPYIESYCELLAWKNLVKMSMTMQNRSNFRRQTKNVLIILCFTSDNILKWSIIVLDFVTHKCSNEENCGSVNQ